MKNRGCYIDEIVTVDSTWTYEQITAKLAEWFPHVFKHVRDNGLDLQISEKGDNLPWWRLLAKNGRTINVVEASHPTGADLLKNKGHNKASIANSHLWFSMYFYFFIATLIALT
jgi:alkylated DNA nucleotide flippase Atl1